MNDRGSLHVLIVVGCILVAGPLCSLLSAPHSGGGGVEILFEPEPAGPAAEPLFPGQSMP